MIQVACLACIGLGLGTLAGGYAATGYPWPAAALAACGTMWLIVQWRLRARPPWPGLLAGLSLAVTTAAAAIGLRLGLAPGLMLGGTVAGLLAWDLAGTERRLQLAAPTDDTAVLARRHLAWLALVAGAGLCLAMVALVIHWQLSFAWTIVLVIIVILGTARLISWLKRGAGLSRENR